MLRAFFTVVYFFVFMVIIDLIFRNTLSVTANLLAVVCLIIALIVSVGLTEYTIRKIKEKYEKN